MAHDEYEHQRRQTVALERIVELLEAQEARTRVWVDEPSINGNVPVVVRRLARNERWGCWWRGFVEADDISDRIVFSANGDTLYHNGGPYGIPINNLCNQPKYWLNHIAGKGWGDSATLASLAVAWADITNASDDERAQAIVWAAEAYDPDHAKEIDATFVAMQDSVNRTVERIEMARRTGAVPPRPCCHATGPNHHPACTTNRTEEQ